MYKEPKSTLRSRLAFGIKTVVALEVACFVGSYFVWRKMNRSQEFRYKVHQKFPWCLEGYYQMGERLGQLEMRQYDYECWGIATKD